MENREWRTPKARIVMEDIPGFKEIFYVYEIEYDEEPIGIIVPYDEEAVVEIAEDLSDGACPIEEEWNKRQGNFRWLDYLL